MARLVNGLVGQTLLVSTAFCGWRFLQPEASANPAGGTVVAGTAAFATSGFHETITTSANAYIKWSSFNIGAGETTTFVQPTANSIVWNNINNANPAQIMGNLNANGFVILQSQSGFLIGGQATLNTHGLILTTAPCPAPNLSSGGAWEFDAPPPTAKIINFGQINVAGGNPAYLIASDIENNGTISAPGGKIGLYAGEKVLVSMAPDGRGLSTEVTLPTGSVDNEGNLIADAGTIAAQAKTVNQNGIVQANSLQEVNGTIELVASDSMSLGANSAIAAHGDSTGTSAGGSVTIKAGNTLTDHAGSEIDISGGAQGGNGGQVEISAPNMSSLQSRVIGQATDGFANGSATIDPANVYLSAIVNNPQTPAGYTSIAFSSFSGTSISVAADNNIELAGVWSLANSLSSSILSLVAGNNITIDTAAGINAGSKWSVNLSAGNAFVPTTGMPVPAAGNDGVYLNGGGYIQTQDGNINVSAVNEVLINSSASSSANNGIRTLKGGNISVNALDGSVNTGANTQGFLFAGSGSVYTTPPYYSISSTLGGISTAAGGNVTINAGGNVTSYLPDASTTGDAGTGTFGALPGNLTINAGGNVTGNYVVADGMGSITAGVNVGAATTSGSFALGLVSGSWAVNAPHGNIYLQEVRNPNGVFNSHQSANRGGGLAGQYLFNYGIDDSVSLDALGVTLTSASVPRPSAQVPVLYPPILDITAGAGGVTLDGNVTLFSSIDQNFNITTTGGGNFIGQNGATLLMSTSSANRWTSANSFTAQDQSSGLPIEAGNPNPAVVNVSGSMENLTLVTSKATSITVGGDMLNCGFSGQNLHASDITSISVGGQIFNQGAYAFVDGVAIPQVPASDLLPGVASAWDAVFALALNPSLIPSAASLAHIPLNQWLPSIIQSATSFNTTYDANGKFLASSDQGFVYNATTGQLGYGGKMTASLLNQLSQPLTILTLVNGAPVVGANGKFETQTYNWANPAQLAALYTASQPDSSPVNTAIGYRIGGPGAFDITANSISLGNSYGILSCGVGDPTGGFGRFADLASVTPEGAALNVNVSGNLDMLTSTIATLGGGNVTVSSSGGSMDLGNQGLKTSRQVGYGIFSSGGGDVSVSAYGDINVDGSRIATYNGGNVSVESYFGNVEVGSGGTSLTGVYLTYVNPATGLAGSYAEQVAGSGIDAYNLVPATLAQGYPPAGVAIAKLPGDITVQTPNGNITSSQGGITQLSLDGNSSQGPIINLISGGDIDLGNAGVIGSSINLKAKGKIIGQFIARFDLTIAAQGGFSGVGVGNHVSDSSSGPSLGPTTLIGSVVNVPTGGGISVQSQATAPKATASAAAQSAAQQANNVGQQLASTDTGLDDEKNKNKTEKPVLQRVKRVTVILPKST